jgi:ubiquitin-conjugating enzyme E2 J1
VRTALVAIRSFMDTDAKGQIGGIECSKEARQRMAQESNAWKCSTCGKSNAEVMKERQEMVDEIEAKEGKRKDEEVPEELRLAYRDELGKKDEGGDEKGKGKAVDAEEQGVALAPASIPAPAVVADDAAPKAPAAAAPAPIRTTQTPIVQPVAQRTPDTSLAIIDIFIYGIVAALLFMVLRRFA